MIVTAAFYIVGNADLAEKKLLQSPSNLVVTRLFVLVRLDYVLSIFSLKPYSSKVKQRLHYPVFG